MKGSRFQICIFHLSQAVLPVGLGEKLENMSGLNKVWRNSKYY